MRSLTFSTEVKKEKPEKTKAAHIHPGVGEEGKQETKPCECKAPTRPQHTVQKTSNTDTCERNSL